MSVELRGPAHVLPDAPTMLGRIDRAMHQAAQEAGQEILVAVRAAEPARTGNLRRQTRVRVSKTRDGWKITVKPTKSVARIAKWVEDGTGIYGPRRRRIRPRHGKAFVLPNGVRVKSTRGQRPQHPFARTAPTVAAAERRLAAAFPRIVQQALKP